METKANFEYIINAKPPEVKPTEIIFVGTGHIFKKSVVAVKKTIRSKTPDFVAVELDPMRFQALKERMVNPGAKRKFDPSPTGLVNWLLAIL